MNKIDHLANMHALPRYSDLKQRQIIKINAGGKRERRSNPGKVAFTFHSLNEMES